MLDYNEFCVACRERQLPAPSKSSWALWCRSGKLPGAVRYGWRWMVPATALDEFVKPAAVPATVS